MDGHKANTEYRRQSDSAPISILSTNIWSRSIKKSKMVKYRNLLLMEKVLKTKISKQKCRTEDSFFENQIHKNNIGNKKDSSIPRLAYLLKQKI